MSSKNWKRPAAKKADFDDAKADPPRPATARAISKGITGNPSIMVPMRDGVRLFTQVYSPLDRSEPHPIILFRTPYGILALRPGLHQL